MNIGSNILVFDTEATIHEKGHPFSKSNRLMCVGTLFNGVFEYHDIEHSGLPYNRAIERLTQLFKQAKLIVGFNLKYDLHWIRNYLGLCDFPSIFDCQLAEFIIRNQTNPYPSLDFSSQLYGMEPKPDIIASQYWERGIDTTEVPVSTLRNRVEDDVYRTYEVFLKQKQFFEENLGKYNLFHLQCEDLKVLAEMEYNGMLYDKEKSLELARSAEQQLEHMQRSFVLLSGAPFVNINSPTHLSALLYGGFVPEEYRETYTKTLKSGRVVEKSRKAIRWHKLEPLVKPLKGSEGVRTAGMPDDVLEWENEARKRLKKPPLQRIYSVDEPTLRSLRATGRSKDIINLLVEQSELEKLRGTYYAGIPARFDKLEWAGNIIHGQFNQCVARTGRLSSSNPNLQNLAGLLKSLFPARNDCLINVDAKSLEWVCAAFLSQDQVAIKEIMEGVDLHEINRERFNLPSRLIAKTFLFRLLYGGSAYSYANDPDFTEVSSSERFWQDIIDETYSKYKGLAKWHNFLVQTAVGTGQLLMPTGRQYIFKREKHGWPETKIKNYPVQGFGADLLSIIRVSLYKRMKKYGCKSLLICTVHDSILIDALDNERELLCNTIQLVFKDLNRNYKAIFGSEFTLPLKGEISIGKNWGNMETINAN